MASVIGGLVRTSQRASARLSEPRVSFFGSTEDPVVHYSTPVVRRISREVAAALTFCLISAVLAFGQEPTPSPLPTPQPTKSLPANEREDVNTRTVDDPSADTGSQSDEAGDEEPAKKEKRGSFIFAPIPMNSSTLGAGLVVGAGYVFQIKKDDKVSRPSSIYGGVAFTSNGSKGGALGGSFSFDQNKYNSTFFFLKGKAIYEYYGVRSGSGQQSSALVGLKGTLLLGDFTRRVWKGFFVGPRVQYRDIFVSIEDLQLPFGIEIPEIDLESKTSAVGFKSFRDSRDNGFYPKKGSYFQVTGDFFIRKKLLGINRNYQKYDVSYNGYKSLGERQVIAYRGMACGVTGRTPFYDLCSFGGKDLRGYSVGQYQNRRMFAAQVEYRRELPKRFGVTGFVGVGGVANSISAFRFKSLLPAAGVGLRYKLDKTNHINYSIDVGVGRDGFTLSLGVLEAF